MFTLFVDPSVAATVARQQCISRVMEEIGVKVDFVTQRIEKTICWFPGLSCQSAAASDISEEVIVVVEAIDAAKMICAHSQEKRNETSEDISLPKWLESVYSALPGKNIHVIIVGLSKYFSKQKTTARQQHRELVTGVPAKVKGKKKANVTGPVISMEEAQEAFVEVQLLHSCVIQEVDNDEDLAQSLKYLTKAVADKPAKKDRLNSALACEGGSGGVFVSKDGKGLAKVWRQQLMQFKTMGADMAEAISSSYPCPALLHQACESCTKEEAEKLLGDINVRRAAGVISTNRRVGREQARRVHSFMAATHPHTVIK